MIDLQLPQPLLNPSRWPAGEALFAIYSLGDGGAFASRRGRSFAVPTDFWISAEPSLLSVIQTIGPTIAEFEIVSRVALSSDEEDEWRRFGARNFRVDPTLTEPSLVEWSREVFPEASTEAGELSWHRELREYEMQLGGGPSASLDRLRFLPPFLRSRKLEFAPTAAREWAYAQALFSPQDDSRGAEGGLDVQLNPTLQVVTGSDAMKALWRIDGVMHSRELNWQQAAVVDELRETPRLLRAALTQELSTKAFKLKAERPFDDVITQLIDDGVILLR